MDNCRQESDRSPVTLRVSPMLRDKLTAGFLFSPFRKMKTRYKVRATIETDHGMRADEFRFIGTKGDITPEYLAQRHIEVVEEQSAPAPQPRSSGGPRRETRESGGRPGGGSRGDGQGGGQNRRPH